MTLIESHECARVVKDGCGVMPWRWQRRNHFCRRSERLPRRGYIKPSPKKQPTTCKRAAWPPKQWRGAVPKVSPFPINPAARQGQVDGVWFDLTKRIKLILLSSPLRPDLGRYAADPQTPALMNSPPSLAAARSRTPRPLHSAMKGEGIPMKGC